MHIMYDIQYDVSTMIYIMKSPVELGYHINVYDIILL